MSNLNPLWAGLLGLGLGQAAPALATATPSVNPVFSERMPQRSLNDRFAPSLALRLSQAIATPPKASQPSAARSLEQFVKHYHCAVPSAGLNPSVEPPNRYEMAALLATCLESLGDRPLNAQEQSAIQTLRSEFKQELAALEHSQADLIRLRQSVDPQLGMQPVGRPSIRWVKGLDSDSIAHYPDEERQNRLGIKAEANFGKVGLFGRYSAATELPLGPSPTAELTRRDLALTTPLTDRSFQNWSAGIGIRGFIIPKSVLTLSAGRTSANALGSLNSINYGAFYQFPIGDRLTVSPSLVIINSPNSPNNPDVQGAVQASFSF